MDRQQRFHGTDDNNLKDKICDNLGINTFNPMTASEYPAYSHYYRNKRKESGKGRIYNHDILF